MNTAMKTKLSLTVYGDDITSIETNAIRLLSEYFKISVDAVRDYLDIELLVQNNDGESPSDWEEETFKATVYASVKRNAAVNFAN